MKTSEMFPTLRGEKQRIPREKREEMIRTALLFGRMVDAAAEAQMSGKFQKWTPEKIFRKHAVANKPPADELHYSPSELGDAWGLSADTIRALFEDEPGVLVMGDTKGSRRKRRYRTIKIPQSVAVRVKNRLSSRPAPRTPCRQGDK